MVNFNFTKLLSFLILFFILSSYSSAKTFYSIKDGNWSDKSSWSETGWNGAEASRIPTYNDTIKIGSGKTIKLDKSIDLFNNGILVIDQGCLEFFSGTITVYSDKGSYVQVGEFGRISNAGQTAGWVIGELRLFVGDGTAKRDLFFGLGGLFLYSPFEISFSEGTGAIAGYLSLELISSINHEINQPISIDMTRLIGPKYWRLMQPEGSTFTRGDRNIDIKIFACKDDDLSYVDSWACCEIGFLRGWTNNFDWQALWPDDSKGFLDGISCDDTRAAIRPIPNFTYFGSYNQENDLVTIGVSNIPPSIPLGSTEKIGNSILLGDFIAGNENQIVAGVEDNKQSNALSYSYTSNDIITFVINNQQINSISIYNIFGDNIRVDERLIQMDNNSIKLDVSKLPNCVYFLKTDNSVTKFIVVR